MSQGLPRDAPSLGLPLRQVALTHRVAFACCHLPGPRITPWSRDDITGAGVTSAQHQAWPKTGTQHMLTQWLSAQSLLEVLTRVQSFHDSLRASVAWPSTTSLASAPPTFSSLHLLQPLASLLLLRSIRNAPPWVS